MPLMKSLVALVSAVAIALVGLIAIAADLGAPSTEAK